MDQETTDNTKFKFLSWYEIEEACFTIYRKMKRDNYVPDSIIFLLRGGVVPARIFADYFGIVLDFFALDVKLYDKIGVRKEEPIIRYDFKDSDLDGKKVLILDDIWESGKTMKAVLNKFKGKDITTATLYWKENAPEKPNYYAEVAEKGKWLVYPWEMHEFKKKWVKNEK